VNRAFLLTPLLGLLAVGGVRAGDGFELKDGDRVVLVGNTLIEREQRYGHWESALTRRWPGRKIIFRNLGWSGDTVFGDARASFDPPAKGFSRLVEGVLSLKPTVIVVAYGSNEAFAGKDGLADFVKGLDKLLDALAPAKARIVLLAPLQQEDLGRPLPDPTTENRNLRLYVDALRDAAKKRGLLFVDSLFNLGESKTSLTDNGIHLTNRGYWSTAFELERGLGLPTLNWRVEIDAAAKAAKTPQGTKLDKMTFGPLRFQATDAALPAASLKSEKGHSERSLAVKGLPPGRYTLSIDGKAVATAGADEWGKGVSIGTGPEFVQSERLREAIVAKNRLYFYRWRPQNETYLYGFRKHEQGKNAREVPLFDPLVEKQETEIDKLRVPATHTYELKEEAKP
jgi:lysophospholipase L1-like esterase